MPIHSSRLESLIATLVSRPGHETVRSLVRELCVVGLDIPDREVDFEVPVPLVRGRIDALMGETIFEFKRDLRREDKEARKQLERYLADRQRETGRRFLGIATDGADFVAYELRGGQLERPRPASRGGAIARARTVNLNKGRLATIAGRRHI